MIKFFEGWDEETLLLELKNEDEVECCIEGRNIKHAKIKIYDRNIYICQNVIQGANPPDGNKLGYQFSYHYDECVYWIQKKENNIKNFADKKLRNTLLNKGLL